MMGSQDEMVSAQLADKELLKQFREVELLSPEDKHLVKTFIDASSLKDTFSNSLNYKSPDQTVTG